MTPIDAIYENGVFKPVGEVHLPEHQRVQVLVAAPIETNGPADGTPPRRSLRDLLGLVRSDGSPPDDNGCDRLREEALREKFGS
jgi:hypothetical protein